MPWRTGSPGDSSQCQNVLCRLKCKSVFQERRFWWVCTFSQARLSLHNSIRISCACSIGDVCVIYTSSEGSGKYSQGCKGSPEPFVTRLSCWPKVRFRCHIWLKRMLWRVCKFSKAHLSLRYCTKVLCVGSNDDLCPINTSSEGSDEYSKGVQPSLRYFNTHCKVITILNKTIAYFIKKMSLHVRIYYLCFHQYRPLTHSKAVVGFWKVVRPWTVVCVVRVSNV